MPIITDAPRRGGATILRVLAIAAALSAPAPRPAWADSVDYVATSAGWTQIGSAGQSIRVQPQGNPVILSTSATTPSTDAGPQLSPGVPPDCLVLTQNLWAKAVTAAAAVGGFSTIKTQTGVTCPGGGGSTAGAASTLTQTRVTLSAGVSTALVAANPSRRSLRWMNTGTNPMTAAPGTGSVTAGQGMNYDPGGSASNQGGGTSFDGGSVPTNAFSAISAGGTTVTVWEGN